jgi:hypothetical protein
MYLAEASVLLKDKAGEYLVPITLAEVKSYIEADRREALRALNGHIASLEATGTKMDRNQGRLLVRAYILKGNLEKGETSTSAYAKALEHDREHPYAKLSLALMTNDESERKRLFKEGLDLLERTKALTKPEITTRGTAIAWTIIAAREIGESVRAADHLRVLQSLESEALSTGGRVPLFFSPIAKRLVTFDELQQTAGRHLESS